LGCLRLTLTQEARSAERYWGAPRERLSWECRCEIVAKVRVGNLTPEVAAATSGVHRSTVYRLLRRFDAEG
jgi:transposase